MDLESFQQFGGLSTLVGILATLLVLNFRTLFRRDQQVWELVASYKAEIAELKAELESAYGQIEHWRSRYYELLAARRQGENP